MNISAKNYANECWFAIQIPLQNTSREDNFLQLVISTNVNVSRCSISIEKKRRYPQSATETKKTRKTRFLPMLPSALNLHSIQTTQTSKTWEAFWYNGKAPIDWKFHDLICLSHHITHINIWKCPIITTHWDNWYHWESQDKTFKLKYYTVKVNQKLKLTTTKRN